MSIECLCKSKRGAFLSLHTHVPTIKQNTKLRGRLLALSTPRWNKQINRINEVWEHLLFFAMLCHQHYGGSSFMTHGELP